SRKDMLRVALLLLVVYLSTIQGEDTADQHLKLNTIKNIVACKQEHNARREDYDAVRNSKTPNTQEGKCFLACLFNKFQVTEGGKYSVASFKKRVAELYKDEEDKLTKANQMVDNCANTLRQERVSDKCEYAVEILECMASYSSKVEVIKDLLKYQKVKNS
ncbi:hypothetical protein L9F63_012318, partial [Diploptera punctata]